MTIERLCRAAGMSRQNFYKARRARRRRAVDEKIVRDLVLEERRVQPRLGGRKLYVLLKPELEVLGLNLGRDRFFEVLGNQGLLVEPLPRQPRTTMSAHNLPTFPNLLRDMTLIRPNQVWVSDITYLRLEHDFAYLSLITDGFSRMVVGHHVGTDLKAQTSLNALDEALKTGITGCRPVHHSDRGSQYCSFEYVQRLQEAGLPVSMTEINHCAENALAERMNGILKQEYGLHATFRNIHDARKSAAQAVTIYNTRRPHQSLDMKTPASVHRIAA